MNTLFRFLASLTLALLLGLARGSAQVPPEWPVAKSELTAKLASINAAIDARWDGRPYCAAFSGNVLLANSNRGYELFSQSPPNGPDPGYQLALLRKIDTMLIAYAKLGYTSVDLTIQYPVLVNSFPNSAHYLDFYKAVCAQIRRRGLKITAGCQATFVDSTFGEPYLTRDVRGYYFNPDGNPATDDSLDAARYKRDKLQMLQTIVDSLHPDYLTLESEPQTQAVNLFRLVDFSAPSVLEYLRYFVAGLRRGSTLIGSGAGTWDDLQYFEDAASTDIDFIDYHIYPVNHNLVDDMAFAIDSIADRAGKKLVIGEAWCYKLTNQELGNISDPIATSQKVFARDVFDYWHDVDTLFLGTMTRLARQSKVEVISLFWSTLMFGQLTYDPAVHGAMTPAQMLDAGNTVAYPNLFRFQFSPLGQAAHDAIAEACASTSVPGAPDLAGRTELRPGPVRGTFAVAFNGVSTGMTVTVSDLLGRQIRGVTAPAGAATLEMNDPLEPGVYLVRAETRGAASTWKLLVR